MRIRLPIVVVCSALLAGCGTTRWSDTSRTATEQLLISDAMDRAVSRLDFRAMAGQKVYLDSTYIQGVTDSAYLISSLRQHMRASACLVMDKREEADYIVEVRAGAVGTDRRDLLFGVPATKVPPMLPVAGLPSTIPEMPLAKKTEQRAVTKIAVYAYNRRTGRPVWQSGAVPVESKAKDIWLLGAGPFQRGTIYEGTNFAGDRLNIPLIPLGSGHPEGQKPVSVAEEAFFSEPEEQLADERDKPEPSSGGNKPSQESSGGVIPAGHEEPAAAPKPRRLRAPTSGGQGPPKTLPRPADPPLPLRPPPNRPVFPPFSRLAEPGPSE